MVQVVQSFQLLIYNNLLIGSFNYRAIDAENYNEIEII